MASIVLSFVGQQDPYSDNTTTEGSIVTLVRHLLHEQNTIQRVILLYTKDTAQRAQETREWLTMPPLKLVEEAIALVPVSEELSCDPIDQVLAVREARRAVDMVLLELGKQDWLMLNASSGTPAMKSCWNILQAAGYAPQSHVWQVRDPKKMQPGQTRVFKVDVNTLKTEFDLKVVKQQIQDYDYGAALSFIKNSVLASETLIALLHYGRCRISLDFDRAYNFLKPYATLYPKLIQEITALSSQKLTERLTTIPGHNLKRCCELEASNDRSLLVEAYFKAQTRLKRQEYSDFLVDIFRLLESIPKFLVRYQVGLVVPKNPSEFDVCWRKIQAVDKGRLYQHLEKYRFPNGRGLELGGFMSRYLLMAILEYDPQFADIVPAVQKLNQYCDQRNDYVHGFKGISTIEHEHELNAILRKVLMKATTIPSENPFDHLNQHMSQIIEQTATRID